MSRLYWISYFTLERQDTYCAIYVIKITDTIFHQERLRQVQMPTVNNNQGHAAFTDNFLYATVTEVT